MCEKVPFRNRRFWQMRLVFPYVVPGRFTPALSLMSPLPIVWNGVMLGGFDAGAIYWDLMPFKFWNYSVEP